jgi:MSHA pilin protein MshA
MQVNMQKQQGFTLIELVVVIIILGILAVTAAPKFMNLQGDARASALSGLKGAIQGANTLVYSKAALAGKEQATGATVTLSSIAADSAATPPVVASSVDVTTDYGYLDTTGANFANALDISAEVITTAPTTDNATSTGDWAIFVDTTTATDTVSFWQNGAPSTCTFTYKSATATTLPVYGTMPAASDC